MNSTVKPRPLREIYESHSGRVAFKWDHYLEVYDRYLSRFRGEDAHLLEIGVFNGGSLEIWRTYLGQGARLTAIDNDPNCRSNAPADVDVYVGDQGDPEFLSSICECVPKFDVVIDDGSHVSSHQIASFEALFPHVTDNGIYIVEDIHSSYWPTHVKADEPTFIEYASGLVDSLHSWYQQGPGIRQFFPAPSERSQPLPSTDFARTVEALHFYDSLLVIEKRLKPEPWVRAFGK